MRVFFLPFKLVVISRVTIACVIRHQRFEDYRALCF